ncbi:MAG: nicotinate-nucleotide--dimethylbenzimidazole phosphoribosyltransferase [Deltaproteobacteria bacterium]|nr:nicotinate-nucleotide--dimethylbenzimidazole phosphoribosyltransferase [Deltaproteobacteria bacterium]MBW2071380.1 nicotinate-nucleotide--dimethylbenzimidazole phosphoribosyltransferase [Deltaproteobacteria bacterium]
MFEEPYRSILQSIEPVDKRLLPAAQAKIDGKTKPVGSLGRLEDLAIQVGIIQRNLNPQINRKFLLVFAGDHGVVQEGVSAYPQEVTAQMVKNFLAGGAAINVLCRHHGIHMRVVDMGVNAEIADHPLLLKKKVGKGTRNFLLAPAMTAAEAAAALQNGMEVFLSQHNSAAIDIVGLGDMGIGNTTAAAAIICAVTGTSPAEATGRGTGIDDNMLQHKREVIEKALQFHRPHSKDGLDVLQKVGGYEIAGIAGAALAAAARRVAVVLDGLISTAAGLIAYLIEPDIGGYLIAGHRSLEPAQWAALSYLHLEPVVDLNMRLGEGTGAALAINIAEAATKIMREMASFEEAGVSTKTEA